MAGLRVGQAYAGVPPTWVWVVGVSPQILEHPTSICDTGVNPSETQGNCGNTICALTVFLLMQSKYFGIVWNSKLVICNFKLVSII